MLQKHPSPLLTQLKEINLGCISLGATHHMKHMGTNVQENHDLSTIEKLYNIKSQKAKILSHWELNTAS